MYLEKREKLDNIISFTIVFQYSIIIIKNIFVSSFAYLEEINNTLNLILIVIMFIMYIRLIFKGFKYFRTTYVQFFVLLSIIIFWTASYLLNHNLFSYSNISRELRDFIVYSLPVLIFIPMLYQEDTLLNYFYVASYVMLISVLIAGLTYLSINSSSSIYTSYSMSFGRNAMIPALILYYKAIEQKNIRDFIFASIILFFIVIMGSRFPILCIMTLILIKILLQRRTYKKIIILYGIIILGAVIYYYLPIIASIMIAILARFNIRSRSLYFFSHGLASYTSGRDVIHNQLYEAINLSPIWGYGAGGGIVVLKNELSHGFIIDTFANLGYIFGTVFLVVAFFYILKAYRFSQNNSSKGLILIFTSSFLPIINIQLSLWSAETFWFVIALSMFILKKRYES